ncbi:tripartite tricarboxylate transporter substrate binding protein [Rhodovarius crocodyli]|uniref:Tripartite tricarboxylate transporter substrate binding protein n=1 Tax=Rhodovarius crocodyli TaxID=1979269 RepID=A0A437MEN2_9PROT|nr:tripartite tricarboxylate transporter substrate binding protein [Rhodovarius crocodyli]RVT96069.1 tripartite tricarboxylate transporter substrate binding protein [Rhodovarius crocodyli]
MITHKIGRRTALSLLGAPALPLPALAQASWPDRPVRIIVPFPGGSTPDLTARVISPAFAEVLGQPCVVDNRPGAGGNIGTDAVAKATDGHTLGISINGPLATAPALFPNLPYNPARDLTPICLMVRTAQVLVVHPSVPAGTLAEFMAYAKANPGKLSYGSVGAGSGAHLGMMDLVARGDLDMVHVPYRGFAQATVDLVAGRIQAMVVIVSAVLSPVREGQLKALVCTGDERVTTLPDVPTLAEAGMPDAASYAWSGLIAPSSIPAERAQRLYEITQRVITSPEGRQRLEAAGFQVTAQGPDAFRTFIAAEAERWGTLIRRYNISPDA